MKLIKKNPFLLGTGLGAALCYCTKFFAGFFFGGLGTVYLVLDTIWK